MREMHSFILFFTGLYCLHPCLPLQYHFIDAALPWLKAQDYCRTRFTDLATVFDTESVNLLLDLAQRSSGGFVGKAWIGLHDNLTNWRWSFQDSAYYGENERSFRNWDVDQPDNFFGDQMCVKTFFGGLWEDSSCFLMNPFFCYDERTFELSSTTQTDQTTAITEELPTETHLSSTTTGRPDKTTTADRDSTSSAQFGTTELDQTTSVPAEHVIHLGLKFTSKVQLREEDFEQLLVEFHKCLVDMGLPSSLKVALKKTEE